MEKKVKILMERYELGKLLGQGNFAKVYYARDTKTDRNVAIKVIEKDTVLKVGLDVQIKREISVMKMLRHPNILQVYEVMASKSKIYIVLEYAKGGELFNRVAKGRLREDIARWIFQQLISAVHLCHNKGVYHRDLKLENLLLDEEGNLKVSDFGLSTIHELNDQDGLLRTVCGTPAYVAPEVINKKGYDGKNADVWSCGVILYAMLAGHLPFRDSNVNGVYRKIRRAEYKCPNWFPAEVRKLLAKILDPNPKTRITIVKIMENPWFMKGLGTRPMIVKSNKVAPDGGEQEHGKVALEMDQEIGKFSHMNAFDIISLSSGFDLSGLFVGDRQREDFRFTSQEPVSVIMSRLKEVAANMRLKVLKKDGGFFRLLRSGEFGDDPLAVDVEVFELTASLHLVELKKSSGDSVEYQELLKDIRPSLNDIVYRWQWSDVSMPI